MTKRSINEPLNRFARIAIPVAVILSRDEKSPVMAALKDISPVLVEATLLHEDKWFRFHPGVSPVSLAQASLESGVADDKI